VIAVVAEDAAGYAAEARERGIEIGHASQVVPPAAEILLADPGLVVGRLHSVVGLRWVQSTWAGVNSLLPDGVPPGVMLTKAVGIFGPQMAEFVFGHLLAFTQHVIDRAADRQWDPVVPDRVAGSTVGIVGTGSIGAHLAAVAACFGMRAVGFNRSGASVDGFERVEPAFRLPELAPDIDHLVGVLPATAETAGLIGSDVLERIGPGATFVNVGRGATVDLGAVRSALETGRLAWAVLDVTDPEPLPPGHPLWRHERCVITSHTAAVSRPSDIVGLFEENLARFRRGETLLGQVDLGRGY
jgi:phosphoglycerate dehydrogenase-like enzyme